MKKLEFWHKTILPATFEDEVSQYEVLAKLVHKINEIIDFLNNLGLDGEIVADRLKHGRKIQLINEVLGSTIFDGSRDVVINAIISPDFIRELKQEIFDIVEQMIQDNKISDEYIKNLIRQEIENIDYTDLLNEIENLINEKLSELEPYELPIASFETLGGIKVGSGLGITEDGVLYVIKEEPSPPEQPIDEEYYEFGYLEYEFDEDNKTASCVGFRPEQYDRNVKIPNKVIKDGETYIVTSVSGGSTGKNIFYPKGIDTLNLGDNIERIERWSFHNTIKQPNILRLPSNLKFIGDTAFMYCNIYGTLEIPETVEEIEYNAFTGNPNLNKVIIKNDIILPRTVHGTPFGGNPTIDETNNVGTWERRTNHTEVGWGWYKVVE